MIRGAIHFLPLIFVPFVALGVFGAGAFLSCLTGCGGSPAWTPADTHAATDAVLLGKACDQQCLSDAGCTASLAAGCFEVMACNVGSMLRRHGANDLLDGGAGCAPISP